MLTCISVQSFEAPDDFDDMDLDEMDEDEDDEEENAGSRPAKKARV